tara:strand:- start:768 stop:1361 length:594 start_codon:yes stop_codon:yes gene_type:complete
MAFKMKGPSLLKMVKQMREGSPMKKDSAASKVGAKLGELAKANTKKKVTKPSDFLKNKYGEDSVRKAFNYGPDEEIGYSPAKKDVGGGLRKPKKEADGSMVSSDMPGNKLQDSMTFDEVFANARKQRKTTFTWRGKSYNTKVKKEETKKSDTVKKVPTIGTQKLKVKKSAEKKGKKDLPDPDFYDVDYEDASDPDRN